MNQLHGCALKKRVEPAFVCKYFIAGARAEDGTEGAACHGGCTANHLRPWSPVQHRAQRRPYVITLVLHVDTCKESLECVEKASAVEFKPKLHPSKTLCHRRVALHLSKEGTQKSKGGAVPCYDALAKALHVYLCTVLYTIGPVFNCVVKLLRIWVLKVKCVFNNCTIAI